MVLAERQSEILRNGRRSRGPSPNGHNNGTPDTSSDDDNSIKRNGKSKKQSEYEEKIRVGRDYQAVCPELVPAPERKPELLNDRALLVWSPTKEIPDTKLEEYISVAKEKYGYNGEQALGMLFWHKHDLERAVMDLANFTPFPDEWTVEDKVLFEQAFQFHGKSFHRIRQMLPDKSIASLVKYYYSWKKTRHRQSVMDRQEKAKASKDGSENGSDNGSNEESDNEDKDQAMASSLTSQDTKVPIGNSGSGISGSGGGTNSTNNNNNNNNNSGGGSGIDINRNINNSKRQQHQQLSGIQQQSNVNLTNNNNTTTTTSTTNNNDNLLTGGNSTTSSNQNSINTTTTNTGTSTVTNNSTTANNSNSASGNGGGYCTGCGVSCNQLNTTTHDKLCNSCYHHWRRTGTKRPTTGPYFGKRYRDRNAERHKRKPPRGMHINHDDIVALASSNNNQDELLANTEREIVSLLSQVQYNKQQISTLKRKISECTEDLRPIEIPNRINARWTQDELTMAVMGVRTFGKNFQAIADTLGTKTEAHIRTFFVNYRRRYNLDHVLKEYEAEREANAQKDDPQQQQNQKDDINKIDMEIKLTNDKFEQDLDKNSTSSSVQKNIVDIIEIDGGQTNDSTITPTTTTTTITSSSSSSSSTVQPISKSLIISTSNITTTQSAPATVTTTDSTLTPANDSQLLQQKSQLKDQENVIMEIDLDSETSEPSPSKKLTPIGTSTGITKELIKATTTA